MLDILSKMVKTFEGRTVAGVSYAPCVVSICHRGVGMQGGYVVTMVSGDNSTSFDVVAAPDELAFLALNKYIRASIKKLYDHNFNAGKVRFEHEISTWCALNIGMVALKGLNAGILKADHCYIKAIPTAVEGDKFIKAVLCKNQEEVAVFNAKQLHQWLTEHSDTTVYTTLQTKNLENELARHKGMTIERRLSITENITIMTMTERLKARINVLLDDGIVFDQGGMYMESEKPKLMSA